MSSSPELSRRGMLRYGFYAGGAAVLGILFGTRPAKACRNHWGRWECQNDQFKPLE